MAGLEGGGDRTQPPTGPPVFLSTHGCMPMLSLSHTTHGHAHAHTAHARMNTHIGPSTTRRVCSPGRCLNGNLLPALASLLHPSRYLWRKSWSSGERRAGGRGQKPEKLHHQALLCRPSGSRTRSHCPYQGGVQEGGDGRGGQGAELKFTLTLLWAGTVPSPSSGAGRAISLENAGAAKNSRLS